MAEDDTRTGAYGAGSLGMAEKGKYWLTAAIAEKAGHVAAIHEQYWRRRKRQQTVIGFLAIRQKISPQRSQRITKKVLPLGYLVSTLKIGKKRPEGSGKVIIAFANLPQKTRGTGRTNFSS
jgi:hypothetical protein